LKGCGKTLYACHSEESAAADDEESLCFSGLERREILRFAQNDNLEPFFCSLLSLSGFAAVAIQTLTG
jgi:hypothetical protein